MAAQYRNLDLRWPKPCRDDSDPKMRCKLISQVWKGAFGYCSDPTTAAENGVEDYYVYRTGENGIEGESECEAAGYDWKNAAWNFDSFGNSLQSVLVIFTYNGWQEILFTAINARCVLSSFR